MNVLLLLSTTNLVRLPYIYNGNGESCGSQDIFLNREVQEIDEVSQEYLVTNVLIILRIKAQIPPHLAVILRRHDVRIS